MHLIILDVIIIFPMLLEEDKRIAMSTVDENTVKTIEWTIRANVVRII